MEINIFKATGEWKRKTFPSLLLLTLENWKTFRTAFRFTLMMLPTECKKAPNENIYGHEKKVVFGSENKDLKYLPRAKQ